MKRQVLDTIRIISVDLEKEIVATKKNASRKKVRSKSETKGKSPHCEGLFFAKKIFQKYFKKTFKTLLHILCKCCIFISMGRERKPETQVGRSHYKKD